MDALTCLLMDTSRNLKNSLTKSLKPFNLTCRQAIVLRSLENESLSAKAIGETCSVDKATLSAVLDKLIEHEYISCEKNQADKREKIYSITKIGASILPEISSVEKSCVNQLLDVLKEEEYISLFNMLKKIQESIA